MTVRTTEDRAIVLEGQCPVEDAETLARLLASDPSATVDWRDCRHAHTAVIRILLAARPTMRGPPAGKPLLDWIEPMLSGDVSV